MTTDRTAATTWIRSVAAEGWDAAVAARGFTRAATALTYVRKVADGGRQRLHLDLAVRPPHSPDSFHLSLRATVAFRDVARQAVRLFGSTAGAFGKSDIVDMGLLDILAPEAPMLLFRTQEELRALAPRVERYLLDPLVRYLDERTTVAALTEAKRAEWAGTHQNPEHPSRYPIIVAAGELAAGKPRAALATLEQAYPEGSRGRTEYAEAFVEARASAAEHGGADHIDAGHIDAGHIDAGPAATPAATGGSSLTFALTTVTMVPLPPVPDPAPDQLERVVRGLTEERFFALLERSDGAYAQVGFGPKAGVTPATYALEHRARALGEHLRADTVDPDEAVRFLQRFRAGDDWRGDHEWRRLELG